MSHNNIGALLVDTGKPAEALGRTRRRWRSGRSWPAPNPPTPLINNFSR